MTNIVSGFVQVSASNFRRGAAAFLVLALAVSGCGCSYIFSEKRTVYRYEPTYPVEYVVVDIRREGIRGAAQFAWDPGTRSYVEIGRYAAPTENI